MARKKMFFLFTLELFHPEICVKLNGPYTTRHKALSSMLSREPSDRKPFRCVAPSLSCPTWKAVERGDWMGI